MSSTLRLPCCEKLYLKKKQPLVGDRHSRGPSSQHQPPGIYVKILPDNSSSKCPVTPQPSSCLSWGPRYCRSLSEYLTLRTLNLMKWLFYIRTFWDSLLWSSTYRKSYQTFSLFLTCLRNRLGALGRNWIITTHQEDIYIRDQQTLS